MTVSARVLYAAVLRMGSVVEAIVDETAAVALEIYQERKERKENVRTLASENGRNGLEHVRHGRLRSPPSS